jgi:serine/threonine protein phosphatase PrpC
MENSVATAQIMGMRDHQEDSLAVHSLAADAGMHAYGLLLVLADGMGGHAGGEVASRLVVDQFCTSYLNSPENVRESLRTSLNLANERLAEAAVEAPQLTGMGTTLIGCVIREDRLFWISVGDSPLWLCRNGALQRLNADHSMVPLLEDMVRTGLMHSDKAQADPRRNLLRSALMGKTIAMVDLCDKPVRLAAGDIVILASDGIETLAEDELAVLLQDADVMSLDELAGKLLAGVEAAGHPYQDNASVILYRNRPGE